MFAFHDSFSDEELHDFGCHSGSYMDDFCDDFGLSEEQIKQISLKHARDMLAKSCTLEDKLADIAAVRWTIRHRLPLPELVRAQIWAFYPEAQIQLQGRKLLGLHNGHDYFFKSLAARAGDLICDYKNQRLTVAAYCASLGCPVSPCAPVIKACRYWEDVDVADEVSVLPCEFAVLVPEISSPCGSMFDMFDCAEDWLEDAQIFEREEEMESEEEMEDMEEMESDGSVCAPAAKVRKIEKQPQRSQCCHTLCREPLPQDRDLYFAIRSHSGEDVENVRRRLCDGANPTVPIASGRDSKQSAVSLAKELLESGKKYLDQLLQRHFCPHQAGKAARGIVSSCYLYVSSSEEAQREARRFLEQLEVMQQVLSLLTLAESAWAKARPSKRLLCLEKSVWGRRIVCPDLEVLKAHLAGIKAEGSKVCNDDVGHVAAIMWDLAQKRQEFGKYPKTLCCKEAEMEAMKFEDNLSLKVELPERRKRQKLAQELQLHAKRLASKDIVRTCDPTGPSCSACHLNRPRSEFSQTQLRKGNGTRRCRLCIDLRIESGSLSGLPSFRPVASPMMERSQRGMQPVDMWRSEWRVGPGQIRTMGAAVSPWLTFDACHGPWKFPNGLMQFLRDAGYSAPTTLQAYLWPALVEGRDTVAIAKSGNGKTLSYLLPGFIKVARAGHERSGLGMLVMVPTRELWHQIRSESDRFGRPANISTAGVFGAVSMEEASRQQCLVATPGHLNSSTGPSIDVSGCRYLVLDKLDQMLDMGFESQLLELPGCLPALRQTAVFATAWSQKMRDVAGRLTQNAFYVHLQ